MKNWMELSSMEHRKVWERLYKEFRFNPSVTSFPSFNVPPPFKKYNISSYLNWTGDMRIFIDIYSDLELKSLHAFKALIHKDEFMYAIDWQHPSYWINPHLEFPKSQFDEWIVPIFPNGDYYFFIQKNFEWGLLGHPWEKTITIFGKELLEQFNMHQPRMLHHIVDQEEE
ncbi:DUF2716 domain-containing protein (plasmid) [Niallia taxi]|uniref:DUF2716 domain-containing protein n=1 Tax=Niallia taxi TaxID=2499688 RepID=UPI002934CDD7|nr:DUF2716 domain-containing protein [Niallia taxi]MED3963103.1 DUF2716 domain-containing protein [Niallia taxi]WOD65423.1 DUF2716 domain-containing protein [Niallia taxi]